MRVVDYCFGAALLVLLLPALGFTQDSAQRKQDSMTSAPTCTDLDRHPVVCPPARVTATPSGAVHPARSFSLKLLDDQRTFWTKPLKVRAEDADSLLPFAAITTALIGGDTSIEKELPSNPRFIQRSRDLSNAGAAAFVAMAGGAYLWGSASGNQRLRETGFLSGEAMAGSFLVTSALRGVTRRDRPLAGNGKGNFGSDGFSFPSEHAALAWSAATVFAHQYPGLLTQALSYGAAAAVSVARVTGREHFASDAFVGSAIGWYFGRQAYRARSSFSEAESDRYGTFKRAASESPRDPDEMASPYVPPDHWVYPVFDRLSALGYLPTGLSGMRPWTRMECARLLEQADELVQADEPNGNAAALVASLQREFAEEMARRYGRKNYGMSVESVYVRALGIAGQPLSDGYHFGQTMVNDYGRPYAEGVSSTIGVSVRAVAGPLALYARGEFQQAPAPAAPNVTTTQAIAAIDGVPAIAGSTSAPTRGRILDTYVSANLKGFQFSFGKQSLWLGPGQSNTMLFSDNAEPVLMLRVDRVSPFTLPGVFRFMGPVRSEFFVGQVSGQRFVFAAPRLYGPNIAPQPYIEGQKLSFKPTPNLEFGIGYTTLFAGPGLPFTFHNFARALFTTSTNNPGQPNDPGDRRSAFDFSYRLPYLRKWLVLYNDSMADDEISPLDSPRRSAMNPGLYMPQFPKLRKLDLRVEAMYTDLPGSRFTGFFYYNGRYRSGYTNADHLLASWIGRDGRGGRALMTYWFSARNTLQFGYRHTESDKAFLGGGRLHDADVHTDFMLGRNTQLSAKVQYETWRFPSLYPTAKSNLSSSVQLTYWPTWRK